MRSLRAKVGLLLFGVAQLVGWLVLLVHGSSNDARLVFLVLVSVELVLTIAALVIAYPWLRNRHPRAENKQ